MRFQMETEFKAIVQGEYGAPEKVLKIAKRQLTSEELGVDDVLVKVIARPIHPGDIQMISALPQGGPVAPIPEGTLRIPGFEGVGTIVRRGTDSKVAKRFSEGQRVAFFPANGTWREYVVVRSNSLLPVPNGISDQIAAQMLIKYDHRICTHQSWSQLAQSSDYASRLHPSECGSIWRWAFADSSCFRSRCPPHSSGEIESVC